MYVQPSEYAAYYASEQYNRILFIPNPNAVDVTVVVVTENKDFDYICDGRFCKFNFYFEL